MGGSRRILLDWQKDGHKLPRKYMDKVIQAIRDNDLEAYKALEANAYNTIKGPYQLWALTLATIVDQLNRRNDYDTDRSVILRESLRICPDSIKQYNSKEISGWSSEHPICFLARLSRPKELSGLATKYVNVMIDGGFNYDDVIYYSCVPELIPMLVLRGIDPNKLNEKGESPYISNLNIYGSYSDSPKWLKEILKYTNPNLKVAPSELGLLPGQTIPTIVAACLMINQHDTLTINGLHEKHIETLLKAGADPNAEISETYRQGYYAKGATALHYSIYPNLTKLLIDNGADVNKQDCNGGTPLMKSLENAGEDQRWDHKARGQKNFEVLLKSGADSSIKTNSGETVLHKAAKSSNIELVLPYLEEMLDAGLDVNAQDDCGATCMHYISGPGCAKICRKLMEHGAELNIQDNYGDTPMHCISAPDAVEACLSMGADPNIRNHVGMTPLLNFFFRWGRDKTVMLDTNFPEEIINIYGKYGADLLAKDNNGKTLIDYIRVKKAREKISMLVHHIEDQRKTMDEDIDTFVR